MTNQTTADAFEAGSDWLRAAVELFGEDQFERARVAVMLGSGFLQLAHTGRSLASQDEVSKVRQAMLSLADEPAETTQQQPDDAPVNLCESDADMARRFAQKVGDLTARIDDALSWLDEPADATPEVQLAKIRAALQGDQPAEPEVMDLGWKPNGIGGWYRTKPAAEQKTPGGFPYRQHPHDLCGSNVERQQVGDPGHCEDCCSVGHVVAHPDLGCGDVGCYRTHGDEPTGEADRG